MSDVPPGGQPPDPSQPPGWGAPPPQGPPAGGYGQPYGQPAGQQPYQQYGYGYGYGGGYAEYAGFWIRFLASFVDGLIVGLPLAILFAATNGGLFVTAGTIGPGEQLAQYLARLAITVAYYALQEGGPSGQTLGKRLCNIRVVDAETGQPGVGPGRAAGRNLMSIVSSWALGIGYLWMLWDPKKQTWHDKVARTIVVKAR
jgi:uncharacterized RDD family membrane protein YckC